MLMAAPFLPVLSGICPRLVSSAEGWDEDCRFVEMLGHTGSLPSLTTLKGNSSHLPVRKRDAGGISLKASVYKLGWPKAAGGGRGYLSPRFTQAILEKSSQQRVEAIGCHLAAFDLVSAPTIGVGVLVAWGGSTLQRVGLWQLLPQMGTDICSGIRLVLDSLVIGSGKQS